MAIRSDEIISIIKSQIESFDGATETRNVGTVVEVGDGIAQVYGLDAALMSELLEFPNGVMGMALNLEEETVGAVILGDATSIKEGDTVRTTGRVVEVPVGAALLGQQGLGLWAGHMLAVVLQKQVHQAGQFGDELGIARGLRFELAPQFFGANLLEHPLLQKWFGRAPQIQLWVEFTPQAFDVEQGFLQQYQLGLYLHVEAARRLKQAHEHHAQ